MKRDLFKSPFARAGFVIFLGLCAVLLVPHAARAQGSWYEVPDAGGPAVSDGAMAYDSRRGVIVAFGGNGMISEQWEYDGASWHQITGITLPEGRRMHDMVYDSRRGVIVMFGGLRMSTSQTANDTWEYDGTTWKQINVTGPSPRYGFRMAYDSDRGVTVLYGSYNFAEDDTWEYDGTTWRQASTSSPINGRYIHAMAYDPIRKVTVLFGGWRYNSNVGQLGSRNNTYTWDGSTWTEVDSGELGARENLRMVFDANWGRIVLFGGVKGSAVYLDETWTWDGQWTKLNTNVPAVLSQNMMAYDSRRARIVIFGGFEYQKGNSSRTFEFDSGYRPPTADVSVDTVRVDGGTSGRVGEPRKVLVDLSNRGSVASGTFMLQLNANQTVVDRLLVQPFAVGDSRTVTLWFTPVNKGAVTLAVFADPEIVLADSDRDNNTASILFHAKKTKKGPDLVISAVEVSPATPTSPLAGAFTGIYLVSFTITNVGTADAGPFDYSAYLTAKKGKIGKKDALVVDDRMNGLKRGESVVVTKSIVPKKLKLLFYFDGRVDTLAEVKEGNETNNNLVRQYRQLPN